MPKGIFFPNFLPFFFFFSSNSLNDLIAPTSSMAEGTSFLSIDARSRLIAMSTLSSLVDVVDDDLRTAFPFLAFFLLSSFLSLLRSSFCSSVSLFAPFSEALILLSALVLVTLSPPLEDAVPLLREQLILLVPLEVEPLPEVPFFFLRSRALMVCIAPTRSMAEGTSLLPVGARSSHSPPPEDALPLREELVLPVRLEDELAEEDVLLAVAVTASRFLLAPLLSMRTFPSLLILLLSSTTTLPLFNEADIVPESPLVAGVVRSAVMEVLILLSAPAPLLLLSALRLAMRCSSVSSPPSAAAAAALLLSAPLAPSPPLPTLLLL
mmetsp:Transcript_3940/g.8333  ORF Transcript_3940/g.8333 Transcript_3940/m.8333 type:complete len:323 (-) Transcript_3940:908-1876(-)